MSELNGKEYTVQYFERAVFELHPENQPPYDVLLSQLGTTQAKRRYGDPPTWPGASSPTPVPPPPPGIGKEVTIADKVTITLRGVSTQNYVCLGRTLEWDFLVENARGEPYLFNVDPASVRMLDSTGKSYAPVPNCNALTGMFSGAYTIPAKGEGQGTLRLPSEQIPPAAAYLDVYVTIGGTPLAFRYLLR